ncbi:hypothetical protein K435DRAFT_793233 [Dendrothele bispora CBS 962.96]|uniref:Uncharacterized protein n=1 Tax=Dendrothele bispora (strain CBS 962.96) TaxID=1314807 RepID=A0A4S8MG74_DENBC|nr:hypothetical protein K435DRAFT_793233 [Dendrothele bispora CBS 962.96]
MPEIDVAQFLGCSPTLNTAIGPTDKAGQNYKYDLIPGGSNGRVYVAMYYCLHTHDHVPAAALESIIQSKGGGSKFESKTFQVVQLALEEGGTTGPARANR